MTREELIRIAGEAGDSWEDTLREDQEFLIRFAAIVAAEKEKQIVDILERLQERSGESHNYYGHAIRVIKGEI